jgi:hypothetical protein
MMFSCITICVAARCVRHAAAVAPSPEDAVPSYQPAYGYGAPNVSSFTAQSPYGGYSWTPWPFPQWNYRALEGQ